MIAAPLLAAWLCAAPPSFEPADVVARVRAVAASRCPSQRDALLHCQVELRAGSPYGVTTEALGDNACIRVGVGFWEEVIADSAPRLAFVLGHEFAHIAAGDTLAAASETDPPGTRTARRARELAADQVGLQLALAAGYSAAGAHQVLLALDVLERGGRANCPADRPTAVQRLAALDPSLPQAVHAAAAFDCGASLAEVGLYEPAAKCFREAAAMAPDLAEAPANVAACLLYRYLDTLSEEELRTLGGEPAGPVLAPRGRLPRAARTTRDDWLHEASSLLEESLDRDPGSARTRASLGLARLLQGRPDEARPLLVEAIRQGLAANDLEVAAAAAANLRLAGGLIPDTIALAPRDRLGSAGVVLTNGLGLELARSASAESRRQAVPLLESYLAATPLSPSWRNTHRIYLQLCDELGVVPKVREAPPAAFIPPTGLVLSLSGREALAQVGMQASELEQELGAPAARIPVVGDGSVERWLYPAQGLTVELLAGRVCRITTRVAGEVSLRRRGENNTLRLAPGGDWAGAEHLGRARGRALTDGEYFLVWEPLGLGLSRCGPVIHAVTLFAP